MNSRTLCSVPGADTVFRAGPGKIHIEALQHMKVEHQMSCWIGCYSREPGVQLRVLVVYDLSTVAVMAMQ